jgi:hypothetical protein
MRFFYKVCDRIHYISEHDDTLHEDSIRIIWLPDNNYHYYECYKGYEQTLSSLMKFRKDFLIWTDEVKPLTDYRKYFTNADAVLYTFNKFSKRQTDSVKMEDIKYYECYYLESTNNGGWIKINDQHKNKQTKSYGYDQPSFYPYLLSKSDFKFPTKAGTQYYIEELDYSDLYYGVYKCDIVSTHPDFCNIFSFAKNGFYTHIDIMFAYKYRKKYNVTITLKLDCDANCLLYEESDLVESKYIFENWYTSLFRGKTIYKDNKVIKHLLSSIFGHLIRFNQIKTDDEEKFMELDISKFNDPDRTKYKLLDMVQYQDDSEKGYRTLYTYIESNHAYKSNFARMKPFFMAFTRNHMYNLLISEGLVNKFIRSHTDNIVLTEPHDFTHLSYFPKIEGKTSGDIIWLNAHEYISIEFLQELREMKEKTKKEVTKMNKYKDF